MSKRSLFLYPINVESAPNWVIRKSFATHFDPFMEYDWVNISYQKGLPETQKEFLNILRERKPEFCFMQLQNPINMSVEMVREMAKHTKIINWSGDVREHQEWYDWFCAIGKEIFLTLFSNETDVDILTSRNIAADYLQVGFDNVWYNKKPANPGNWPEIVFCANNYGNFQLSNYRGKVVKALKNEFGERFGIFGNGWYGKWGIEAKPINNLQEAEAYNTCKIAISVSNFQYKRYHSDRLLRIMGCGAFPLSHEFEGIEKDFMPGGNLVTFSDLKSLIEKCHYYLSHDRERIEIANNAYIKAHLDCTWDVRCKELITLINKHESKSVLV